MKFLLVAALVAAVAFASTGVPTVTICSAPNALLQNIHYTITPDNIQPGTNLKVSLTGTLTAAVESANVDLTASFDGIPVYHKTLDLCKDITCPVKAGPFSYTVQHQIPNVPISGTVDAKAVITAQNNEQVVCANVQASI